MANYLGFVDFGLWKRMLSACYRPVISGAPVLPDTLAFLSLWYGWTRPASETEC